MPASLLFKTLLHIPKSIHNYFSRLTTIFSTRFVLFLFFSQFLVLGSLKKLVDSIMLPLFKSQGLNASEMQYYLAFSDLPWSIEPLVGIISDLSTIGGYHLRFWLVSSIILGTACAALLVPSIHSKMLLLLCFIGIKYEIACCELMSICKVSEIKQTCPESGSDCITLCYGYKRAGGLLVFTFVGIMADRQMYNGLFLIAFILCASPFIPCVLGWLPEDKVNKPSSDLKSTNQTSSPWFSFEKDKFHSQRDSIMVIAFAGAAAVAVMLTKTYASQTAALAVSGTTLLVCMVGVYNTMPLLIAHVTMYQVITNLAYINIESALDYFYLANEQCLPNGPHFSYEFYISYTSMVGALASFAGVWVYQLVFTNWRFRAVLIFSSVFYGIGQCYDLLLITRTSVAYGVPDKVTFLIGKGIVQPAVIILRSIACSALLACSVPKGLESSTIALMQGLSYFAAMISKLLGAFTINYSQMVTVLPDCNFEPLGWLTVLCHGILPSSIGVLAALLLVPNKKQNVQF